MEATRPNGRLYRSRKPPVTVLFEDTATPCVLVLRCASYAVALGRAVERVQQWDSGAVVEQGKFGWWRESIRNSEPYWDHDEGRGAPGWLFQVS